MSGESFLDELTGKQAQKVTWVMKLVEEMDVVPAQYFQKMPGTDDLWEIRAQYGGDIFRLYGFFDGRKLVVLAHGIAKKTQKVPRKEIEITEARKRDYFSRRKS